MRHVTHVDESCHTYERVESHTWVSHATYEWVTSHMNKSCHTYERVTSHTSGHTSRGACARPAGCNTVIYTYTYAIHDAHTLWSCILIHTWRTYIMVMSTDAHILWWFILYTYMMHIHYSDVYLHDAHTLWRCIQYTDTYTTHVYYGDVYWYIHDAHTLCVTAHVWLQWLITRYVYMTKRATQMHFRFME